MRISKQLQSWFGVAVEPKPKETKQTMDVEKTANQIAEAMWTVHAAMDMVYGKNFAKENPQLVAQFMQAIATQDLAKEMASLRDIFGNGSGAFTIGIEKAG